MKHKVKKDYSDNNGSFNDDKSDLVSILELCLLFAASVFLVFSMTGGW